MKMLYLFISASVIVCGCDHPASGKKSAADPIPPPEHSIDHSTQNTVRTEADATTTIGAQPLPNKSDLAKEQIEARARELIARQPTAGELSKESVAALVELVPKLRAQGVLWKWIGAVPPSQLVAFREAIMSSLKALTPKWLRYQPCYKTVRNTLK